MNLDPRPVIEPDISGSADRFGHGPHRVWTKAHGLPLEYFKRHHPAGPPTVVLNDDTTVAVVETHNQDGCELRARRFLDPHNLDNMIAHELDGTTYSDRFTANRAAFDAGLTGVMIYDNQRSLIRVFHTRETCSRQWGPHPQVIEVARYLMPPADEPALACNDMWVMSNNGNAPYRYPQVAQGEDPRTVAYRARGNRPLHLGDIVSVDGTFYRCAPRGWDPMRTTPVINQTPHASLPSTPIDPDTAPPVPATPDTPA